MHLISEDKVVNLSPYVKILRETDGKLSISEAKQRLNEFTAHTSNNPNYGLSTQGIWLYTTLSNVTRTKDWVLEVGFAQLDNVDIYLVHNGKVVAGTYQGKEGNPQQFRFPTMKTRLPYAQTIAVFVRLTSEQNSLIAPLKIQSLKQHERTNLYDNLLWGLFYGSLLSLAIYNLVLFVGIREKSLLAYVGYICTVLLWQFVWGGHMHILLAPEIGHWFHLHTDITFLLLGIGAGIFTYVFLNAPITAPKTLPFIKLSLLLLTIVGVLSLLTIFPPFWQNAIVYLLTIVTIGCYSCAGFESVRNNFRAARYFITAWGILGLSALIGLFSLVGLLPNNFFTSYCFQFGVLLEAGFFSLALMDKTRQQLEQEIMQATGDLRNNVELIEEQNVRLDLARKNAIAASYVKSQFLANMSHEIRTPLNAILGFSKELQKGNLPVEKKEQVDIINAAADNLLNIVNDVLDVSKIEAGKMQINNHAFSPNELLEEMIGVMAKSAHMKNLEFIFNIEPLPQKLMGDSYRIKQILNNLLGNALKFTDHGHIGLSASGKLVEDGIFEFILRIEDTGIGISREDKRKLFTAFSQVEDALNRSYQGTGLGLVICKELVKLMHGRLSWHSVPGQGSTINVSIRTNILDTQPTLSKPNKWQGLQVLLYDPYPHSRLSSSKLLCHLGAKVTSIESLAYLKTQVHKYDYIFTCLPGSLSDKTQEVLDTLRQIPAGRRIICCSGPESSAATHQSQAKEFYSQIRLPLTPSKLDNIMCKPTENTVDELQQRLQQLPAVRVLAVDDMEMNLRLLSTWLKPSPLLLDLAYSGQEALQLCQLKEFDLILMDVQMPHMDGLQTSQLIRHTELNLGTPIIAITAHAFKEEQDRLLASGMDDYLPKPLELSSLVDLIKRWCHQGQPQAEQILRFDWHLALKRANGNASAAEDVFEQFITQLPALVNDIEHHSQQQHFSQLMAVVHKLHGACCYTGVPLLHGYCSETERLLKNQQQDESLIAAAKLVDEAGKLLTRVQSNTWQFSL
ncbi:MAG: two-component system sensor histidine kinase BarA [Paraglaciecola sp.]